ncbi:uncharacterized protein P174DRAFT_507700 [Aspergillus novofumigatus IBT 16806]|uniref:Uncharacterized protein n=1 Tax=Aspergillus novofumigatus (strain IBT 16806) TaxID=1392255 RepID=A0A2I1BVM0_ASPN1|nr:uncharacterized protein P174DRAFT_507700 [Aspergillus novofumigatus IBT 16806]PKX89420.1 hypothetical protein P174DRAFT_507700 [Aspergillus novofumigatus IBT 16806]
MSVTAFDSPRRWDEFASPHSPDWFPKVYSHGFKQTERSSPHLASNKITIHGQYILKHNAPKSHTHSTNNHPTPVYLYAPVLTRSLQTHPQPSPDELDRQTLHPERAENTQSGTDDAVARHTSSYDPRPPPQRSNHRRSRPNAGSLARWTRCSSALRTAR